MHKVLGRVLVATTVVATLVASLSGCTARHTAAATPVRSVSTSSASPAVEPGSATPHPEVDLTCDQAFPASFLAKQIVSSPVTPVNPADAHFAGGYGDHATGLTYHLRALGGLDCAWWDGVTFDGTGADPSYATVTVVPVSSEVGRRLTRPDLYQPSAAVCSSGSGESIQCSLVAYENGYFVEAVLHGIDGRAGTAVHPTRPSADIAAAFDQILEAIRTSKAPSDSWVPPGATLTLPTTCAGLLNRGQLTAALGSTRPLFFGNFGDGYGVDNAAIDATRSSLCTLQLKQVGHYSAGRYGYLGWLPGGAWAAAEDARLHHSTAVDIPGLQLGDSASTYWSRPGAELTADLVIGGDWIEFTLNTTDTSIPQLSYTADAAATRMLTQLVANLRS